LIKNNNRPPPAKGGNGQSRAHGQTEGRRGNRGCQADADRKRDNFNEVLQFANDDDARRQRQNMRYKLLTIHDIEFWYAVHLKSIK